jgi:hypothetical protein
MKININIVSINENLIAIHKFVKHKTINYFHLDFIYEEIFNNVVYRN